MTRIEQENEHLRKAEEAETQAETTPDPALKETWKRIAVTYRDLAQMLNTKSGRLFS